MIGIIMGSSSDLEVMREAVDTVKEFGAPFEVTVVSAHRTPERMVAYAKGAAARGVRVIIAGAGGAAHLPGMVASLTTLPVIGVPIKSRNSLDGWDSLLSIAQMPAGVPVATMAVNGSRNAGLLAIQIMALGNDQLAAKLNAFKEEQKRKVEAGVSAMRAHLPNTFDH
ncbi:MAG: 5-(carboxyamino)imidazole ribonucleotide mutase [Flavobacteriales bacterium]|nr:5-(carboxyamino)imidazole ribonucleotide mutase [Flavobacteriales bacterium]MEB2341100.1 5-(carboxyamino)imidazole ribonucleotide mutase [Flavobacteriia bacterium]